MKQMTKAEMVEFIKNDLSWPNMVLPLIKRSSDPTELGQIGILLNPVPKIYLTNMWNMDVKNCKTLEFSTIEEMVEAGGEVD